MNVLFSIILAILLFISIMYLTILVQVKINITIVDLAVFMKLKIMNFHKNIEFRLDYFELIRKYFIEKRKEKYETIKFDAIKRISKVLFINNIDVYSELFEDRLSIAIKFNIVNIITKKSI